MNTNLKTHDMRSNRGPSTLDETPKYYGEEPGSSLSRTSVDDGDHPDCARIKKAGRGLKSNTKLGAWKVITLLEPSRAIAEEVGLYNTDILGNVEHVDR